MHFRGQGFSEEDAQLKHYYFCGTCGESYANKASLRLHKLYIHRKDIEEVPCNTCGITFRTIELSKRSQVTVQSQSLSVRNVVRDLATAPT